MKVVRTGENLRGRKPKTVKQPMKLVPLSSLPEEQQAELRANMKGKRERKNVWVPA